MWLWCVRLPRRGRTGRRPQTLASARVSGAVHSTPWCRPWPPVGHLAHRGSQRRCHCARFADDQSEAPRVFVPRHSLDQELGSRWAQVGKPEAPAVPWGLTCPRDWLGARGLASDSQGRGLNAGLDPGRPHSLPLVAEGVAGQGVAGVGRGGEGQARLWGIWAGVPTWQSLPDGWSPLPVCTGQTFS